MTIFKYESYLYLRGILLIVILDSLVIDDEPIWEPLEWSLVQTWLLFIYIFAWSAEVIFSSRYGLYTNRDKKVWIGLHKAYWFIQLWFMINILIVTVFVTLPFYFEITYTVSYIILWWNWYNSIFFFKLITFFSAILLLFNIMLVNFRWIIVEYVHLTLIISFVVLNYFLFFNFLTLFYGFFTDVNTYTNTNHFMHNKLVNGPLKWGWGSASRDHFAYHRTTSVFYYKNDPLIAASMLFISLFYFISLFFLVLQHLVFIRVVYTTSTLSFNFLTFIVNTLRNFYLFSLSTHTFLALSIVYQLLRFPFEFYWFNKVTMLLSLLVSIIHDAILLL